uniref:Uncharacterized protein n=1 Tax=Rhizophora mucronata TaxID=61149 RepID=A0A2P2NEG9_RHIMU
MFPGSEAILHSFLLKWVWCLLVSITDLALKGKEECLRKTQVIMAT